MYLALLVSSEGATGAPLSPFEVNFGLFFWTWLVFIALSVTVRMAGQAYFFSRK